MLQDRSRQHGSIRCTGHILGRGTAPPHPRTCPPPLPNRCFGDRSPAAFQAKALRTSSVMARHPCCFFLSSNPLRLRGAKRAPPFRRTSYDEGSIVLDWNQLTALHLFINEFLQRVFVRDDDVFAID